jgi:CRISPR/Cas system-associated endoribonuclease Cas2
MVLLPYPTINMVKTKVTLVFNSPFMKDRTFTVSDISKDRRDFTKSSTVSLRSLTAATNSISETTSAILDFTEALEKLEIAEEDSLIIMPLMKEVINAVRGATGDIMMKGIHRMMRLQKVLTRVASRLQESNLLSDLMEEDSKKKYWIKSNLRDHVKMVMR